MPSAEIIAIGTELLLGEISDTNTRFIARALRSLGLDLFRVTTVGDNTARITEAIQSAMQRADVVLTTGGLGPTVDDPTRQAAAAALGVELEFQEDLWRQVVATVARYGRQAGENQKRQAFIPHGARAIPNPVGTAPAFLAESGSSVLVCLPGVPREMETLLEGAVVPYLRQRFSVPAVIEVRNLHLSGVSEAWVDERVGEYETQANPTVGLAAHNGIIDIRICAKAADVREAGRMIEQVEKEIRLAVGPALFGV
ncbi:MAG: competence/damage-inducible protein A, partial [Chloroflexi bacterium]|nr:competence/damage-inducible protein A [Chloroflexota bacterium]